MNTAFLLLAMLIGATPAVVLYSGLIAYGIVAAAAAIMVALVGWTIRPGGAVFLLTLIRPIAIFAAVPALWMVIQTLPLSLVGLSHPIWESASAALERPISGGISIDPGATLISLSRYLSVAAIGFAAAAISIDRQRAGRVLFLLTAATALTAVLIILERFGEFQALRPLTASTSTTQAQAGAVLGLIFSAATAIRAAERYQMRRRTSNDPIGPPVVTFSTSLIAFAVCAFAIQWGATSNLLFAGGCGLATLLSIVISRRLGLGRWGYAGIMTAAYVIAIWIVVAQSNFRTVGLALAFAAHAPEAFITITQRILADGNWAGTGAGTFPAVVPVYRDLGEVINNNAAPTTATAIIVEMGWPLFWLVIATAIAATAMLLRSALMRGRDSFYSAAGASCIIVLLCESFGDPTLLGLTIQILGAVALGLALAQSKSRTIQYQSE